MEKNINSEKNEDSGKNIQIVEEKHRNSGKNQLNKFSKKKSVEKIYIGKNNAKNIQRYW